MYTVVFNKLKLLIVITLVERHTDERRIPLNCNRSPKVTKNSMWYVIVSNDLLLIGQLQELAYNFIESIVNKLFHFCYYFVKVKIHDLKNAVVAYKPGTCTLMRS